METREKSGHTEARKRGKSHRIKEQDEKKENDDRGRSRKSRHSEGPRKAGHSVSPTKPKSKSPKPRPETPTKSDRLESEPQPQPHLQASTSTFTPDYSTTSISSSITPPNASAAENYSQSDRTTDSSVVGQPRGLLKIPEELSISVHGTSTPAAVETATEVTLISETLFRSLKISAKAPGHSRSFLGYNIKKRIKADLEIYGEKLEKISLYIVPDELIKQPVALGTEVWQKVQSNVLSYEGGQSSKQYPPPSLLPMRNVSSQIGSNDYYSYQSSPGSQLAHRAAPVYLASAVYQTAPSEQNQFAGSEAGATNMTDSAYLTEEGNSTPRTLSTSFFDSAQHSIASSSQENCDPRSDDNIKSSTYAYTSTYPASYSSTYPATYPATYPSAQPADYLEHKQDLAYSAQRPYDSSPAPWKYHDFNK